MELKFYIDISLSILTTSFEEEVVITIPIFCLHKDLAARLNDLPKPHKKCSGKGGEDVLGFFLSHPPFFKVILKYHLPIQRIAFFITITSIKVLLKKGGNVFL